jgi:peroxiredoxin
MTSEFAVAVERPNRIAIVLREGFMGGTMVCDGTKMYTCIPQLKRYVETAAPTDFDALFGDPTQMAMAVANRPSLLVLTSLIQSAPVARLLDGVTAGTYLGEVELGGVRCRHARFEQADFDWEIWVEAGDRPLLRQLAPDMSKALAQAEEVPDPLARAKITMLETLTDWQVNPALPADTFQFTPPADATKVDSLFGDRDDDAAEAPHSLTGQPAPDLTLDLLDGGKLELARHRGKDVVVLDFWATWCGPCRKALPEVAATVAEFAGKGVALYAVNQDETPEVIRRFLQGKPFTCAVALDPGGKAGELYKVEGIPQTVIIDRAGKVQAVHVGYDPSIRQTLREQIATLLAGKDLNPAETATP